MGICAVATLVTAAWAFGPGALSAPHEPKVILVEVGPESGIDFKHSNFATPVKHLPETMGSGVALLDYDNDGLLDIYLVNAAPLGSSQPAPSNRLYRNLGNWRFQDVTAKAGVGDRGYGMGVAVGDYDNDGWIDLYLTNFGPNVLYRNRRDGTFENVTAASGTGHPGWGASAGFFDYDRDGDLDLYVTNYLEYSVADPIECKDYDLNERSYCHPHHFQGAADVLYRNEGDGTFRDVGVRAGIADPQGKGLGVVLADFDGDGWPDIYVANDSVGNHLYRNLRNGRFEDLSLVSGAGYSGDGKPEAGMGVDAADLDGDGLPELFVTNLDFETNTLYRSQGDWAYEDRTIPFGLAQPSFSLVGFGTRFFDVDSDGDLDLFVANGHILDNISRTRPWLSYPQVNQLYLNRGGVFADVSASAGKALSRKGVSRGLALGDIDNDGDVDLVVSNCGQRPSLLRNDSKTGNNWLLLRLNGTRSNRSGIGARIRLRAGGREQRLQSTGGTSYLSAHDLRLHVGLGKASEAELIEIVWPSGARNELVKVKANQILILSEKP